MCKSYVINNTSVAQGTEYCDTSLIHEQVKVETDTSDTPPPTPHPRLSPFKPLRAEGWMSPMELLTVWLLLGKHAYVITETKTMKDWDKFVGHEE